MIGHAVLFFLAGFAGLVVNVNNFTNTPQGFRTFGGFLVLALLIGGVYFLGWLALLTLVLGIMFGAYIFMKSGIGRQSL